jgi:hypothetical protein
MNYTLRVVIKIHAARTAHRKAPPSWKEWKKVYIFYTLRGAVTLSRRWDSVF